MQSAKYHALGNDYLVVEGDGWDAILTPVVIRRICDRHLGIGSDGILVRSQGRDPDEVALRILNSDGTEAEKSGNGLRIFVRYLWDRQVVSDRPFTGHNARRYSAVPRDNARAFGNSGHGPSAL